ncbi:MAG TPA: DUF87 domain-containing protein [Candidatus Sulfotelmatobacter sp.]|nr:DUF87 domain-containing protein [Candidatus Sulfotelmatobacter sp.]
MNNIHQFEAKNLLNLLTFNFQGSPIVNYLFIFLPYLILLVVLLFAFYLIRKYFILKHYLNEKQILLEITPPASLSKESFTTDQLFSLINELGKQKTFKEKLLGFKSYFSLEIVSTKDKGIRFIIRSSQEKANTLKKSLISYIPHILIKETIDYIPRNINSKIYKVVEFKLKNHFAYPLKQQNQLDKHDPISYITGMMTKLKENELIALQIILTPTKPKESKKILKYILKNGDVLSYLNSFLLLRLISKAPNKRVEHTSISQNNITNLIEDKVKQPLFESSLRIIVISENINAINEKIIGIKTSFSTFANSDYQSITAVKYPNIKFIKNLLLYSYKNRLSIFNESIFSTSEISEIYHFPYTKNLTTEDLVRNNSKILPAPLSLKNGSNLDIVFGINNYANSDTQIGLSEEERETHMYIIGRTGSGKTTMMFSMAKNDIEKKRGLAFLDPHGDVSEDLISIIPKERINDLVYINPIDLSFPIGINLLELTEGLSDDELELEKEVVCEGVISLFRKVFSKEENINAHRIEYILRNAIYTAFTVENRTIFTVYDLLNNPPFQKQVVSKLTDENLKNFWKYEFGRAGEYQIVKMVGGVTAKIGRFLFSPTAKRILEQPKSTINFSKLMDEEKIIICNLSQGKLGEDTSRLLGTTIMTKIQQAALKRAYQKESERVPFYLYVDEFQNFATHSFTKMLSEGRKYKLRVILAEQSTSQQDDRNIVNVILANVTTVACFRTANYIDEDLMLDQFAPFVEKTDIANLPKYNFYIKVSALEPQAPFSGITIFNSVTRDFENYKNLINASRNNWAIKYQKKSNNSTFKTSDLTTKNEFPEVKFAQQNAQT